MSTGHETQPRRSGGRRYGGAEPEERQAKRRAALVEAGLAEFGADGYAGVSVRAICARAGLTQRYFYESFADRSDLLADVYRSCVELVRHEALLAAGPYVTSSDGVPAADIPEAARATLKAFLRTLTQDPRRARVILVEVVGVSPQVEQVRLSAIHDWAEMILLLTRGDRTITAAHRLTAIGLVGAVTQLLVDWYFSITDASPHSPELRAALDIESILDVLVDMFVLCSRGIITD